MWRNHEIPPIILSSSQFKNKVSVFSVILIRKHQIAMASNNKTVFLKKYAGRTKEKVG